MPRSESALAVSTTSPALEKAIKHAEAGPDGDDGENYEQVADDAGDNRHIVLRQV